MNIQIPQTGNYPKSTWPIIAAVILTALIAGGGVYAWQKSSAKSQEQSLRQEIQSLQSQIAQLNQKLNQPAVTNETADWGTYRSSELGISFEFPSLPGEVEYSYNDFSSQKSNSDQGGIFYKWSIKRSDSPERGWKYIFAGGQSENAFDGRGRWPTDNYRWLKENNKYYLNIAQGEGLQIEKEIESSSGVKSIILGAEKNPGVLFGEKGKLAVVNFPTSFNKEPQIKSISFYFYDPISTEDIEKVIESLKFSN